MFKKLLDKLRPKTVDDDKNFYGGDKTWHSTGTVDVQLDKSGKVVAVWFRCKMLPFTQSVRDYDGGLYVPVSESLGSIKGIVFEGDE